MPPNNPPLSSSTLTLRYFPLRWRAEGARFILLATHAPFTDETPSWPSAQTQQPLSQLPVLIERTPDSSSDYLLSDSVAIEYYLARRAGLVVDSGLRDSAREMELRNQMEDLHIRLAIYIYGAEAGREMAADRFMRLAKSFVDYHEGVLARNGSNGHYFGSRTTYVDISLYLLLLLIRRRHEVDLPGREDVFSKDKAPGINRVYRAVKEDALSRPIIIIVIMQPATRPSPPAFIKPLPSPPPTITHRIMASSPAPSAGRPSLWTRSAERKMTRLYVYTTLPLETIVRVVHWRDPESSPGIDSANRKLRSLLDKEPRWLHPRDESDMCRRLAELSNSPTRTNNDSPSSPISSGSDNSRPGPPSVFPPRVPSGDGSVFIPFLRQTTWLSTSTDCSTGSFRDRLPQYSRPLNRHCLCRDHMDDVISPWLVPEGITTLGHAISESGPTSLEHLTARDSVGNTLLHFIAARCRLDLLSAMLRSGCCQRLLRESNAGGQTFLLVIASTHLRDASRFLEFLILATACGADVHARDVYGRSVFHMLRLARHGPETIRRIALHFPGPAPDSRDAFGLVPTASDPIYHLGPVISSSAPEPDLTIQSHNLHIISRSLDNPSFQDIHGRNALHILATTSLSPASIALRLTNHKRHHPTHQLDSSRPRLQLRHELLLGLLQAGVPPNHYDSAGETPLMAFAAHLPEDDDYKMGPLIIDLLIRHGADVNARNRAGETALHVAVRHGRKLAIRSLVRHGASVHARDARGRSLLDVADAIMAACVSGSQYAHYEACRAWLSGDEGKAIQRPGLLDEWGFA
ncbi:hypothetical protein CDD80_4178 [Ophiocordyceps camponoti-rufipedis]|uniref:GST N-terminal domain-containing protein n=1 Tax=Ophiocordyceps camponoti-rufipedis TaxID=2004952 RepID=A0A2C5YZX2_9HYPO|nr:hypothetical protein CDD80_4178 [Ophiocordyceps camponoti-rufipedis]